MNQVHKETLTIVENALGNRSSLDVEIFGMEGIPEDVVQAHNQRIITQFYQAEAERRAATGNAGPGTGSSNAPKKPKFESPADLKKRLAEHKARMAEQAAGGGGSSGANTPAEASNGQSPGISNSPAAFVSVFHYDLYRKPTNSIMFRTARHILLLQRMAVHQVARPVPILLHTHKSPTHNL